MSRQSRPSQTAQEPKKKPTSDQKDPDQPCFTKKEVRDILFERNELKTNLFLVQEELSYYQRCVLVLVDGHGASEVVYTLKGLYVSAGKY